MIIKGRFNITVIFFGRKLSSIRRPPLQPDVHAVDAEEEQAPLGGVQPGAVRGHQAVPGEQLDGGEPHHQQGEALPEAEPGATWVETSHPPPFSSFPKLT